MYSCIVECAECAHVILSHYSMKIRAMMQREFPISFTQHTRKHCFIKVKTNNGESEPSSLCRHRRRLVAHFGVCGGRISTQSSWPTPKHPQSFIHYNLTSSVRLTQPTLHMHVFAVCSLSAQCINLCEIIPSVLIIIISAPQRQQIARQSPRCQQFIVRHQNFFGDAPAHLTVTSAFCALRSPFLCVCVCVLYTNFPVFDLSTYLLKIMMLKIIDE